jgi:hypothetical protein
MRQAIHIFRKDVQGLRFEIAGVLVLTLFFAVADVTTGPISGASQVMEILLPAAWCFLIARAIHAEAIPGDRQFWLTRPYDRQSLWAAKALFALVFISLPMVVAQAGILFVVGLPVASNAPALLWEQVLIAAVYILPAAALAAVTANMVQFALAALVLVSGAAIAAVRDDTRGLGPIAWLPDSAAVAAILAFGCAILFLQFMHRRTALSRMLAEGGAVLAAIVYLLVPWGPAFAVQSWMGKPFPGTLAISLEQNRQRDAYQPAVWRRRDLARADVPLQISGIDLSRTKQDLLLITIETSSGIAKVGSASIEPFPQGPAAVLLIDRAQFDKVKDQPARIHGTLFLTELGDARETTLMAGGAPASVPGVGQCFSELRSDDIGNNLICQTAFRWPSLLVSARVSPDHTTAFDRAISYSPFPAELTLSPVVFKGVNVYGKADSPVTIVTQAPVSHFRYEFELPEVRLRDYALPEYR